MASAVTYKPGEFCWTDLGTTDVASAKKFYRGLFGWSATDVPMRIGKGVYSMMGISRKRVCAIYPMDKQARSRREAPMWLPFVSVRSLDATLKKIKAARGSVAMGPADVADRGRVAVIVDPTGAPFAVWQPRKHRGAEVEGRPGAVSWHDLNTTKPKIAADFYSKIFGWKVDEQAFGGNSYFLLKLGKEPAGGIWPKPLQGVGA